MKLSNCSEAWDLRIVWRVHTHTQLCSWVQAYAKGLFDMPECSKGITSIRAVAERFICLLTLVLTVNLKFIFCLTQNSDLYLIVVGDCPDSVRSWWEMHARLGSQHRFTRYSKGSVSAPAPVAAVRTVPAVGTSQPQQVSWVPLKLSQHILSNLPVSSADP